MSDSESMTEAELDDILSDLIQKGYVSQTWNEKGEEVFQITLKGMEFSKSFFKNE